MHSPPVCRKAVFDLLLFGRQAHDQLRFFAAQFLHRYDGVDLGARFRRAAIFEAGEELGAEEQVPLAAGFERRDDIAALAEYFVEQFHASQGLPLRAIPEETVAALQAMRWPGNIRQLRNVIERVLILGEGSGPIQPAELEPQGATPENGEALALGPQITALALREARELFEREYLLAQINRFGGNISRTAQFVGMERSALHRKLKSLGVVGGMRVEEEMMAK